MTPVAPPKTSGHSAEGALNCITAVCGSLQSMFETNDMGPGRRGETGGLFVLTIAFRVNAKSSQDMGMPSDQDQSEGGVVSDREGTLREVSVAEAGEFGEQWGVGEPAIGG